ncbi:hypothetical protein SHIRM173S_05805 [Streptomyces hirsutus]
MAGHTDNHIVIDAPMDIVWEMTNDVPQLAAPVVREVCTASREGRPPMPGEGGAGAVGGGPGGGVRVVVYQAAYDEKEWPRSAPPTTG